jgi:ADP-ribosylglycohydrolase
MWSERLKKLLTLGTALALFSWPILASARGPQPGRFLTLSRSALRDKIKGGWAGQAIGCTFGGPTEFRFQSTFIPDYQPLSWDKDALKRFFENEPGLYDDIYMDLTFVEILEAEGLEASAVAFAERFAKAGYPLWHANQMARFNILNGIAPPRSGHWLNNPHADDIDFQIEADFAGLMSPGMVGAAANVCDRVGHIMNYGDGYYGGLYIAAIYALAFVEKDVHRVVEEALGVIPAQSAYSRTIRTAIEAHRKNPGDWQAAWFEVQQKWGQDVGCPEGVFSSFNIDAKINSAWVVLGLLFGDGDFGRTLSVSARCGDDSDCNPASAGGILGTIIGYDKIPAPWKEGLRAAEGVDFQYTKISLAEAYELSFKHSLEMIKRNGGKIDDDNVLIKLQMPSPAPLEVAFEGHFPRERRRLDLRLDGNAPEAEFEFDGIGFAVNGAAGRTDEEGQDGVLEVEMSLDGAPAVTSLLPTDERTRKPTLFWRYRLPPGHHKVRLRVLSPPRGLEIKIADVVIYAEKPATST